MKGIQGYNWEKLYKKTEKWMERERIPGKVDRGRQILSYGYPCVAIDVPVKGNKAIIERVGNYRFTRKRQGYVSNGERHALFLIRFTEEGEMG